MRRFGERLLIAALIASILLLLLLLVVPGIRDAIWGIVVFLFGERGSRYIGTLLGILSLLSVFGAIVRWVLVRRSTETTLPTTPVQRTQAPAAEPAIRTEADDRKEKVDRTRTRARRMSRELYAFTQESIPVTQDVGQLYRTRYLPEVTRVRDAFADLGVKDPELDRLYQNDGDYNELRALAARLLALANSL